MTESRKGENRYQMAEEYGFGGNNNNEPVMCAGNLGGTT